MPEVHHSRKIPNFRNNIVSTVNLHVGEWLKNAIIHPPIHNRWVHDQPQTLQQMSPLRHPQRAHPKAIPLLLPLKKQHTTLLDKYIRRPPRPLHRFLIHLPAPHPLTHLLLYPSLQIHANILLHPPTPSLLKFAVAELEIVEYLQEKFGEAEKKRRLCLVLDAFYE